MFSILLVLLVIVAVLMTGLILLQKSEGSGMSGSSAASMFGGALTGAAAGNFLTRATAWLATIFFVLCAALALIASKSDMGNQQSELRHEIIMQESGLNDVAKNAVTPETVPDAPAPVTSDKK